MKKTFPLIASLILLTTITFAQTEFKQYKAGHTFDISLPSYMSKTGGVNDYASIQYHSVVKDVMGFVIVDTKEELSLVDMNFSSVNEFYEDFIKDFLIEEKKRKVSKPFYKKIENINFVESDVTYYDKEAKTDIYYLVGIVETDKAFYKVLSWATAANKDTFKADFQQILYSLKD
jgi:hypothetical protein